MGDGSSEEDDVVVDSIVVDNSDDDVDDVGASELDSVVDDTKLVRVLLLETSCRTARVMYARL